MHSKLLERFAESQGLDFKIGKSPDGWDIMVTLSKRDEAGIITSFYVGYGSFRKEAYHDLLNFIMKSRGWANEDEMNVWLDLNSSSTSH